MGLSVVDLDDWESVADMYDPGPYKGAFMLENMVLGQCSLVDRIRHPCYTLQFQQRYCKFLFDCWPAASYCGPEFVRKYKIKPKGGCGYDADTQIHSHNTESV